MPFTEARTYSPIPDAASAERSGQARVLFSRTISLAQHTDFLRELFQNKNATFETYNPSAVFINPPDSYRAVRVDSSDGRTKSVIFKYTPDGLEPHPEVALSLEDPFASNIGGQIVFGGVQVDKSYDSKGRVVSNWRTILYKGTTIPELKPFFIGPEGMKDIRPVKRPDGKIGVYTRPRNPESEELGGNGQIGYREFDSLDQLGNVDPSILNIQNTPLLSSFRFPRGQWGGVNHVQVLEHGKYQGYNLLFMHRAYKNPALHYSAGVLLHDPKTERVVDLGTLIKRSDLPPTPWKEQNRGNFYQDVVFPGELIIEKDRLRAFIGAGDAQVMEVEVAIPLELAS